MKGNAVWITQLVVSFSYRNEGIAGTLISLATNSVEDVVVIGLASSHPYAVLAPCNACNRIPIDLKFIADHAKDVIRACNVPYLSNAQLVGSIFNAESSLNIDDNEQRLSLIKTDFFVDHEEPLTALKNLPKKWILGPLLDGCEFFVVLPTTSVRRSRTFIYR